MNDNDAPQRTRSAPKPKIVRVEDGAGHGAYYYSTSTATAKSIHCQNIIARPATDLEIMDIAKRGIAVHGLPGDEDDDGVQSRFDMEAPSGE